MLARDPEVDPLPTNVVLHSRRKVQNRKTKKEIVTSLLTRRSQKREPRVFFEREMRGRERFMTTCLCQALLS
jgi:hypothetical protein